MSIMRVSMALTQAATYSVSAVAAVLLVLAVCLAGCSRSSGGAPVPAGVSLSVSGPSTLATEPGARSVLLLSLRIRGLAKDTRVESLSLQIHFPKGAPRPLAQLQLFMDVNADGVQDPLVDMAMAQLVLSEDGRVAKVALDRRFSRGQEERWLIVGNVRPAAMATSFHIGLDPKDLVLRDGAGRQLQAVFKETVRGPLVSVADRQFAAGICLSGGGSQAAIHLPSLEGGRRPARIVVGGNAATGLTREAPGVYSFLLPGMPAGKASLLVLDGAGKVLARLPDAVSCNGGSGPARFVDVSLTHLPLDHAFSQDAEVCDVDGDGDPDLIIPSYAGQRDRLYLNDGHGRFTDVTATHMPDVRVDSVHLEPFDADGDGDVDIAVAVEGGPNRLYLNDGSGHFTDVTEEPGRFPSIPAFTEDLRAGDIDGDGDLDLVSANLVDYQDSRRGGQLRIYINDGRGFFKDETQQRIALMATRSYDVNLGDLDSDGDLDLFVTGYGETNRVYANDGTGVFDVRIAQLPLHESFHTSAVLGDVDGDGDLDVVVGTFLGQSLLYLNQGGLRFVDASRQLSTGEMSTYDVSLADLDGDSDLDIVFANTGNPSVLLINDGQGRFSAAPKGHFFTSDDNAYDVQVLDADGDGALDILVTAWGNRQDTLYLSRKTLPPAQQLLLTRVEPNSGPPEGGVWVTLRGQGFRAGMSVTLGGAALSNLTVADPRTLLAKVPAGKTGVAPIELRVPGSSVVRHAQGYSYEQAPAGAFRDVTSSTLGSEPAATTAVAAGDLNGDGLADLVFADLQLGARVRINTGNGVMRAVAFQTISASANDVELVDLDQDGKLDLLLADSAGRPWVFAGKGDGSFAKGFRLPAPTEGSEEVAVGDIDGDKDLDLVFAVFGSEVVLRNDGNMNFTVLAQKGIRLDSSKGVALGDVDGDKDLDLFVANFMQRTRLYLNNGKGIFTEAVNALPNNDGDQSFSVALADVDGDGDLDAVIANGGAQVNRLFLGDGHGQFKGAPIGVFRPALGGGAHVIFGDVDGDGGTDLFSAHFWGNNHLYFSNRGRLVERSGVLPNSPGGFAGAVFVDIDGDRDLDLVLAAFWGGSRILLNPRLPEK